MSDDLALATIEELVQELFKRVPQGVIALEGIRVSGLPEGVRRVYRNHIGDPTYCLGMATQLQHYLFTNINESPARDPAEDNPFNLEASND